MTRRLLYSFTGTPDDVSQLYRDVSTALTNICEWRNSLTHINRTPSDVLSLIPTYLDSQTDRFSASHVCRHWRRTFLQHAAIWSHIFLSKGEVYIKTLLERARGSPLDIITNRNVPDGTITLLSPHTRQIKSLDFTHNYWTNIQRFSDVSSGPQPLLRTLKINVVVGSANQPNTMTPPSLPLFSNAVNLERFVLCLHESSALNHFVFPNLTTFVLLTSPEWHEFQASDLLNFLETSPMLRKVKMEITERVLREGDAQRGVVVLPNVQTFSLVMDDCGGPAYELAAHISCPSASHTSLIHKKTLDEISTNHDERYAFPTATSWDVIVRQYTTSPVEAISFEIKSPQDPIISCFLTFRSSDGTIIRLGLEVSRDYGDNGDDEDGFDMSLKEAIRDVFVQASRTVQDYPLPNAKHLHILHRVSLLDYPDKAAHTRAIVELARSRYELGRPFEHVTIRAVGLLVVTVQMVLEPWVGVVDCYRE